MKKLYEAPEVIALTLRSDDVIQTSGGLSVDKDADSNNGGKGWGPFF